MLVLDMELRDYFAAHMAAALAHKMERPETIAARAYDLADALARERVRRPAAEMLADDELPPEAYFEDDARFFQPGLLDEPAPMTERDDDAWLELADGAAWAADAKPIVDVRASDRPGLARTAPLAEEKQKKTGA